MNPLNSLVEYEEFLYTLPQRFPAIDYSTLVVARCGVGTATVRGEVIFSGGLRLVVSERLMLDAGLLRIVSYGYEVWRGAEKLYWYDPQPHPLDPSLASALPHHKHVPPDIKHHRLPAPSLSFTRANLPFLISEIEQALLSERLYIAVDLGAGSGRVFLAGVAPGELLLEEVRRFHYPPSRRDGHLRWDWAHIFIEMKAGLRAAGERARELGRPIHSIGVDSWGVDYGLVDAESNLVEGPICYRDERTQDAMERVFSAIPREEIYARTGIQFLHLNTLFQLHAHSRSGIPASAAKLLLIPDLINFMLTGKAVAEYTNATTTQLVNAGTGAWDEAMLKRLSLPAHLLTEIVPAGSDLGLLKPELAEELKLAGVRVVAPATHDTGSAVAGALLEEGWAYISSGTWSLVGVELGESLINPEVARHNFTNEGGAFGTIRFLKNVMGLWLLESCRKEWQERGLAVEYDGLLRDAASLNDFPALFFPDDARLFNPASMTAAIAELVVESGQTIRDEPPAMTKAILDSLALRYASVIRTIESLTGKTIRGVQIVGGGSQNHYLNQATANATGKPVLAGPVEATVIGNVLVQAIAAGRFATHTAARRHVAANVSPRRFEPQFSSAWAEASERYAGIAYA
ncbi:MAG: toxin-antitoxin system TumE family protein [Blastocatellia bacterium]